MTENRIKTYYTLRRELFVWYPMSKFLPTRGFKWIDSKEFDFQQRKIWD